MRNNKSIKVLLAGVLAYFSNLIFSSILWMNPGISQFYKSFDGHPSLKDMNAFGGTGQWVALNYVFGIFLSTVLLILFLKVKDKLGNHWFRQGFTFACIVWLIKSLPEAFNQWMLTNYPNPLILIQLGISWLGLGFLSISFSFFLRLLKAETAKELLN